MEDLDPSILTPGIRKTVLWLRENGFETTDSGDGITNVEAGMECALDIPHVIMTVTPLTLVTRARDLCLLVEKRGIEVRPGMIQSSYDPADGSAVLALYGISDGDLESGSRTETACPTSSR